MSPRLLSFLADVERALLTGEPNPRGGAWENVRTVNYHHGLARLTLAVRRDAKLAEPVGTVMVQSFRLADGTTCLKAYLSWTGNSSHVVQAIYERADSDWKTEAGRVSAVWLEGRTAVVEESAAEPLAAAG